MPHRQEERLDPDAAQHFIRVKGCERYVVFPDDLLAALGMKRGRRHVLLARAEKLHNGEAGLAVVQREPWVVFQTFRRQLEVSALEAVANI